MSAVEDLLKHDIKLPSPPAIAVQILELVRRDDFSLNQLGTVIQADPALATRILGRVNSGFYSIPDKVGSIDTAVAVLGVNAVKNIALSFTIPELFKEQRAQRFDFDHFWRRSAVAAVAADLVAKAIHFKSEETFTAALLQDIGVATMALCRKDEYLKVLDAKAATGLPITTIETQIFGFDHQEVGARLLREWGLPESIYLPIQYHHCDQPVPSELKKVCEILLASDRISAVYCGSNSVKNILTAKKMLSKAFGLSESQANALVDRVAEIAIPLLSLLEVDSANIKPFSKILQQAQHELSRLNLSYEMLVLEYKQAKEKSERLAMELKAANDRLREMASRDGLTGLYNHRHLQEMLVMELALSDRYKRPCALVMFDLDKFKMVNDIHGHRCGDAVLQAVSAELSRITRKSDFIARYGGEEFAVLLTETNLSGAVAKAEACCAAVRNLNIDADGVVLRLTMSGGVAAYDPSRPIPKDRLIQTADRALFRSKRAGGNRVSVAESVA